MNINFEEFWTSLTSATKVNLLSLHWVSQNPFFSISSDLGGDSIEVVEILERMVSQVSTDKFLQTEDDNCKKFLSRLEFHFKRCSGCENVMQEVLLVLISDIASLHRVY